MKNIKDDPLRMLDRFLANGIPSKLAIGIDPGGSGAIALVNLSDRFHYTAIDIPRVKKKTAKREEFSLIRICEIFSRILLKDTVKECIVVLEQVPASVGRGKKHGTVMINRAWAMWPLFLTQLGYKIVNANPLHWKKDLGLLKKDKEVARMKAKRLFPNASIDRVKDHNRAEALLLVHWHLTKKGIW